MIWRRNRSSDQQYFQLADAMGQLFLDNDKERLLKDAITYIETARRSDVAACMKRNEERMRAEQWKARAELAEEKFAAMYEMLQGSKHQDAAARIGQLLEKEARMERVFAAMSGERDGT